VAAVIASLVMLVIPCVIAFRALGLFGALLFGVPALFVAVPWFVTLYLVQGFAAQIAVLEHRDAIHKARLFLHGRLLHGLKLIVATFVGTLVIAVLGVVVIAPAALGLFALA